MAQRKYMKRQMLLSVGVALGLGFLLYVLLDPDSFVRQMLDPENPAKENGGLLSFVRNYGYWIFIVYIALTAFLLFLENRNPDRTLTWLLVLGLFPVAGLLFYWFVGPNFRYLADKRRFRLPKPPLGALIPPEQLKNSLVADTAALLYRSGGAKLQPKGGARLLIDGTQTYAAMIGAMEAARHSILLESYILADDGVGETFKELLMRKARDGVKVCVIYDAVGSWRIGKRYVRDIREAGGHIFAFLPVSFPMFRGANYRNHRKILVVDNLLGFLGGLNICDDCAGGNIKVGRWRDTHLMIRGGGVAVLRSIFFRDLAVCGAPPEVQAELSRVAQLPPHESSAVMETFLRGEEGEAFARNVLMQIAASGPDTAWDTIQKAFFSMITRATKRVWITTPYMIPGDTLLNALCMAALSGVDVRVLLPGKGDHALVTWASMNCLEELLRAGARVFLYSNDGFVHAKTVTADGSVTAVGTANFDTRSLSINFEVQAFVYDEELTSEAEAMFERDLANAVELTFAVWSRRSLVQRIKENIGKLISPLA
ncbi:cardiolipin synthase [Desulfovibrio sp. OttesenSCG-928-I05]|nr:cardiolipin synthase [Desulfovibrio sp. OttesenSCG-928-I05]